MIGSYLIDMLDENGYISGDLDEVSEALECDIKDVERVLKTLQGFDPVGIFARDLSECLELQLRELNRFDPAMAALLRRPGSGSLLAPSPAESSVPSQRNGSR